MWKVIQPQESYLQPEVVQARHKFSSMRTRFVCDRVNAVWHRVGHREGGSNILICLREQGKYHGAGLALLNSNTQKVLSFSLSASHSSKSQALADMSIIIAKAVNYPGGCVLQPQ